MRKSTKLKYTSFYRYFLSIFAHPINFLICLRFPFMKCRNVWDRRFMGYTYTMLDDISVGWRKAFGKQLCKDIKKALKEDGFKRRKWKDALQWEQIKSKYGQLRLYATATESVDHILTKYEYLSICYCEHCGKPARYVTDGWIEYLCADCFKKVVLAKNKDGKYIYGTSYRRTCFKKNRLSRKDIPESTVYYIEEKKEKKVDFKKEYNIDYAKLWAIKDK